MIPHKERLYAPGHYPAVVAAEIAVASMALGLPGVAALFSLLNAAVLAVRLRAETRAWAGAERVFFQRKE